MGEQQRAQAERGQGYPSRIGPFQHIPKGQNHPGIHGQGHEFRKSPPHIHVHQMIRGEHVQQPGHKGRPDPPPAFHQLIHAHPSQHGGQCPNNLNGSQNARPQQIKHLCDEKSQGRVKGEQRIPIPLRVIWSPARPQKPTLNALMDFHQPDEAVTGIVGVQKIPRGQQRRPRENTQQQKQCQGRGQPCTHALFRRRHLRHHFTTSRPKITRMTSAITMERALPTRRMGVSSKEMRRRCSPWGTGTDRSP